jgi:cell division septation protein DedD
MKFIRFSLLLAIAASAASTLPAAPSKTVRDGITAWQNADYASAVAIWRPLAEKGDADAAFNLGQAYRLGRGVTVDLAQAQKWLERSARAGHLDAQTTLGLLLFDSGSHDSALTWLKKAAERGDPRAMLVYGTALFNGDSVARDPLMAYAYVSRSAAQGLEPAKTTLAEMDKVLPVEVRRRAVEIALQKAAEAPAPSSKPAKTAKPAKVAAKPAAPPPAKAKPAPATTAVAAAPAKVASAGKWRIQLGAFSKRESAESLYRKFSGALAGHRPFYVPAGAVTRLQVGPYPSRAAAAAACASLKGQACFPVETK